MRDLAFDYLPGRTANEFSALVVGVLGRGLGVEAENLLPQFGR